jgi:putative ABC transport system permease protein
MTPIGKGSRSPSPMWRRYLRLLRPDVRADVADEMEFHIEMIAAKHIAAGRSPDAARALAVREFGDMESAKRQCEAIGAEQERRHEWAEVVDSTAKDVRFALRSLARTPGFATALVLTLALGVGASTAIFTVVRGVLLRPLPYAEPDRLVRIWEVSPQGDDHNVVSAGNYVSWKERARSFSVMGAHNPPYGVNLVGVGDPIRITTADLTPSAMQALGVGAALGRTFTPDDASSDGRLLVLSHAFWQRQFAADRGIVGRQLRLNDVAYTVVGVMPASFEFPSAGVDVWRPVTDSRLDETERRSHNWLVIARLAPGATAAQASTEMRAIAGALTREFPQFMTGYGTNVVSLGDDLVVSVRPLLLVLLVGSALLLVVACANIANLLLARSLGRRREIAVRGALGAGRGRIVRQLLTESLVIAVLGGIVGVVAAAGLTRGLVSLAPSDIPRMSAVEMDAAVVGFALAITVASGVLFGLAPVARLVVADRLGGSLQTVLRAAGDRSGSGRSGRARSMLLVAELAISLVLLTGAGLLLRSAANLGTIDYGFRPEGIVTAALHLPLSRYDSSARHVTFYSALLDRVRQLPGVAGVATTTEELGSTASMTFSFAIQGKPSSNPSGREDPEPLRVVSGDYFTVMGIPVRRGRVFTSADRAGAPDVVIVNESLARKLWPDRDPVGARVSFVGASGPWVEIVGVVGDTRANAADEAPIPAMYMPFAQKRWNWMSWSTLVVRTAGTADGEALRAALRGSVLQLDAQLPIQRIASALELYRDSVARRRFATVLTGAFAAAALALGMVGMYGVLSYGVDQRRREFGIRLALGARPSQVTTVVVREALTLAALAVSIGTVAALALTRLLDELLFEVSPTDPVTFVAVAILVAAMAAAASWVPARRATRIDPATTIRDA